MKQKNFSTADDGSKGATGATIGSFLFDYLHKQGVETAFGIPGDFALATFRWLEASPIKLVTLAHEPSVGFAADGYARMHGLGVACVTYCVGGLNMLNSIACAYAEKSPVIVISGGPSPTERHKDTLLHHKVRSFDTQRKIFEEVTCANTVLNDPATAADEIIRVVEEVKRYCRPGYIEVPYDLVDLPIAPPKHHLHKEEVIDQECLEACVQEATAFIAKAERPVILAGVELHRHGLTDKAVALAQKCNIPIAATLLSKSVIRETNPLYIGVYSGSFSEPECQHYVDDSDGVVMLGTFITDIFLGLHTSKLTRKQSMLVTTEEARIGLHNYKDVPFSAFLDALLAADIPKKPTSDIIAKTQAAYERSKQVIYQEHDAIGVESFFHELERHIEDGGTLVCDTGDALLGAIGLRTSKRRKFLADAYYLSMGFAIPAGIGAICADPDSKTYIVVGDGAFQMTGLELATIAKYRLSPVVIILNNDGYGTQRHIIDGPFNDITRMAYAKMPELVGFGKGYKVATIKELKHALHEAKHSNELAVIEVVVPRDNCSRALRQLGEQLGKLRNKSK